jgi:hypothetical protein
MGAGVNFVAAAFSNINKIQEQEEPSMEVA